MENPGRPATSLSDAVAKEIRVLLVRREMKQTELAARLGVNEMWLSRRLRGAQALDLNDLDRIAAVLEVQITDLLPRREEGHLITTGGSGSPTRRGTNDRSVRSPVQPHLVGHMNRTSPPESTRRPERIRRANA